jgi:hypothetical protein
MMERNRWNEPLILWIAALSIAIGSVGCGKETAAPEVCQSECGMEGETRCTAGSVESCVVSAEGCGVWSVATDCGAEGHDCSEGVGGATCGTVADGSAVRITEHLTAAEWRDAPARDTLARFDFNGDGRIDAEDAADLRACIAQSTLA